MKKLLLFFVMAMLAFAWQKAQAQDLIYKKNKEVILAKIIEIGTDDVKYKEYNSQDGIIYGISKAELWKVKFENGKEQFFVDEFNNSNLYADNKKNALKMDFLAPLYYKLTFAYERSLKPGMSYEVGFGIIGFGHNPYGQNEDYYYGGTVYNYSASGAFGRFGFKFIRTPDYYLKGMRYAHILKGSYIKPEITIGNYNETAEVTYTSGTGTPVIDKSRTNVTFGALMLNFGKQWIFNDIFLVDYYVGVGYCFDNKPKPKTSPYYPSYDNSFNNYALYKFGPNTPFSINAGLKVGILLK